MSPGNLLNRQGSTFATGQERRSPSTQHGHNNDVIAIGDAKKSKDLWLQAYEALELREPDLVAAYKRLLAPTTTNLADSSPSPELIETIVKSKLQDREANQLVINLGTKPVKVREQGEKVIIFILWSNQSRDRNHRIQQNKYELLRSDVFAKYVHCQINGRSYRNHKKQRKQGKRDAAEVILAS